MIGAEGAADGTVAEGAAAETVAEVREEIRFAVVLNGGVSLAVWMGGVVREIDRLTRRAGGWGPLMDRLGVKARADVISGTSAGGINGAALALAQINELADLNELRRIWSVQGRMETLLQDPRAKNARSVLRGEAYFLPELTRAMERLTAGWRPTSIEDRPVDLTITTTLLKGAALPSVDSFGADLLQSRHDGWFHFTRLIAENGEPCDQFSDTDSGPGPRPCPDLARKLALAARASAGYPYAFEPTFIPAFGPELADRPDLGPHASWGLAGDDDVSRFAVDGGLLANTPTEHAIGAISRMRASSDVDRVMLLVIPRPSGDGMDTSPPAPDDVPTLLGVGGGLLKALASRGGRSFVDEVVRHNREHGTRRATRAEVVATAGDSGTADAIAALAGTADVLFPYFAALRRRRSQRDLARTAPAHPGWSDDDVTAAIAQAQAAILAAPPAGSGALAYVPAVGDDATGLPAPGEWRWGSTGALDIADAAADLVRTVTTKLAVRPPDDPARIAGALARDTIDVAAGVIRHVCGEVDGMWAKEPLKGLAPTPALWLTRHRVYRWFMCPAPDDPLDPAAAGLVNATALAVAATLSAWDPAIEEGPRGVAGRIVVKQFEVIADALATFVGLLDAEEFPGAGWAVLSQLIAAPEGERPTLVWRVLRNVHVVAWTLSDEPVTEGSGPIRFTQIHAATANPFALVSRTYDDKLGGDSLARFGGFLKSSWRMNDWAWGRCDAITRLTQVLVTPARIRRAYNLLVAAGAPAGPDAEAPVVEEAAVAAAAVVAELVAAALPTGPTGRAVTVAEATTLFDGLDPDDPLKLAHVAALNEVLAILAPPEAAAPAAELSPLGPELPITDPTADLQRLIAYLLHFDAVAEELPVLARAVADDAADAANPGSYGARFTAHNAALLSNLQDASNNPELVGPADRLTLGLCALEAFDESGIGQETPASEAASDQFIRTAATGAAAALSMLDSSASGLPAFAKPATRALRGASLVPYWLTRGLTGTGTLARLLGAVGIGVGGTLLVAAALGWLDGAVASAAAIIGAGAFVTVIAIAALRSGSVLHSAVLTALLAVLVTIGARADKAMDADEALDARGPVAVAVALIVGLMVLGTLPQPMPGDQRLVLRRWWPPAFLLPIGLAAAALGLVFLGRWLKPGLHGWWFWGAVAAVALVVVATFGAIGLLARLDLRLRGKWKPDKATDVPATASWAVLYGAGAVLGAVGATFVWDPAEADPTTARWAAGCAAVIVLALLFGVPVGAYLIGRGKLVADVRARLLAPGAPPLDLSSTYLFAQALADVGGARRFLVTAKPVPGAAGFDDVPIDLFVLAEAGYALRSSLEGSRRRRDAALNSTCRRTPRGRR